MRSYPAGELETIRTLGRTAYNEDGSLSVFWTGSGIECRLRASELFAEVESIYGSLELWIDVMIDGELSQRIQLPRGRSRIPVFQGLLENGERRVRTVQILRDTQAMAQDEVSVLKILSLTTDDGASFEELPPPGMRLEFIGDSITSGEGAGLAGQVEWAPIVFSAVDTYSCLTAGLLGAQTSILSSSGWGLYAAWDGDTDHVLPPYYDEVCGLLQGEKNEALGSMKPWDFSSWRPDAVVVNLGTNDQGALRNTTRWTKEEYRLLFIDAGVSFLKKLRKRNPDSFLIWAYGMLGNEMAPWIRGAIENYRGETGDDRVEYFEFDNCDAAHLGARAHPNRVAHREAAEKLAAEIRSCLGVEKPEAVSR